MPELLNERATQAALGEKGQIGYGLPSAPAYSFDIPVVEQPTEESIFHPIKAFNDLVDTISKLTEQVSLLVQNNNQERTFIDRSVQIDTNVAYNVDYLEHKYLYALVATNTTLVIGSGGTLALTANTWTNVSFPRGTQITLQTGASVVIFRACDVPMR